MDPRRLAGSLRGLPAAAAERVQDYLAGSTPDQLSAVRGLRRGWRSSPSRTPGGTSSRRATGPTIDLRAALAGAEVVVFSLNSSTLRQARGAARDARGPGPGVRRRATGCHEPPRRPARGDGRDRRVLGARQRPRGRAARARARGGHAACWSPPRSSPTSTGPPPACATRCSATPRSRSPTARTSRPRPRRSRRSRAPRRSGRRPSRSAGSLSGATPPAAGRASEVEQFVIDPNEIKTLRTGEAVVISKLRGDGRGRSGCTPPARGREGPER